MAINIHNKGKRTFYCADGYVFNAGKSHRFEDAEGKKLLDLYPGELVDMNSVMDNALDNDDSAPAAEADATGDEDESLKPLGEMTLDELQVVAKSYEIKFTKKTTEAELIALIEAAEANAA